MKRFHLPLLGLLAPGLLLLSCSDGSTAPNNNGNALGSGTQGEYRIVYSTRVGTVPTEIAIVNADGSGARILTDNGFDDIFPTVSPNGSTVMFQSFRNGDHGLHLVDIDGTNERQLVPAGATGEWSPDGSKVLYTWNQNGNPDIWMINADGTDSRRLTTSGARDAHPTWSPDGTRIAFVSDRERSDNRLFVMNADGSNQRPVSTNSYNNSSFHRASPWSSDSRRLVYAGSVSGGDEIFVVNADGTAQRQVTNFSGGDAGSPAWSPDDRSIAFVGEKSNVENVYVIDADGSNQRQLTPTGSSEIGYPHWSPDGTLIVFEQIGVIMVTTADGSDTRRVSAADARDNRYPLWSPVRIP